MADVKWIKITTDIFDDEKILLIESMPESDAIICTWLKLLAKARLKNSSGVQQFKIANIDMTDDVVNKVLFHCKKKNSDIHYYLDVLEKNGFIKHFQKEILVIPWWQDRHDRNSTRYRYWRKSVFERDGFVCQGCGTKNNLQAHHIIHWQDCKDKPELRYYVENGITLCRKCHLEAHGGNWRG